LLPRSAEAGAREAAIFIKELDDPPNEEPSESVRTKSSAIGERADISLADAIFLMIAVED
jgi:predicted nucleic acid-binding protein